MPVGLNTLFIHMYLTKNNLKSNKYVIFLSGFLILLICMVIYALIKEKYDYIFGVIMLIVFSILYIVCYIKFYNE